MSAKSAWFHPRESSSSWRISPGLIGLNGRSVFFILVSVVVVDLVDEHILTLPVLAHRDNQTPFTIQSHRILAFVLLLQSLIVNAQGHAQVSFILCRLNVPDP